MVSSKKNDGFQDDDLDLLELFGVIWAAKLKIIIITSIFAFLSVVYALSLPNEYKASTLLAPAQKDSGGLASTLGQLGGLASIAGVNIPTGESSESQIAQEIMKSRFFIENFISENNLEIEALAVNGWNKESNTLRYNAEVFDEHNRRWRITNDNEKSIPSGWQLFKVFESKLSVVEDKISGLVTVSMEHYSPIIAKRWLDLYIQAINKHMQERQVKKVSNNIEYLRKEVEKTPIAEMQEVFYTLIEQQTKAKMLAQASPEYAFVAVSPSMIPAEKSKPKRAKICILGTFIGGMISVIIVLFFHYVPNEVFSGFLSHFKSVLKQ